MSKKKLLLFTDGFPWDPGETPFIYYELGVLAEQFDIDIIAFLRKKFASSDVCVALPENVILHKYIIEDIGRKEKLQVAPKAITSKAFREELRELMDKHILGSQISEVYMYLTRTLRFLSWITNEVDIDSFDVCYTYWNSYATLALAMYKEKSPNIKLVTRTHGYDLYHERTVTNRQCFKKYVDKKLDKVAFIADTGKEYYLDNIANDTDRSDKYIVNPIGVTKAQAIPQSSQATYKTLVSCSSVIPLKRVEMIAQALSTIDDIQIKWIHFGGGSEFEKLKSLCKDKLDNKTNIQYDLKGQVANTQVRDYYNQNYIDCFITTSSTEGSPVSIQEALCYGIPVIGTDVGEISALIDGCGSLMDANPTVEEVADNIKKIFVLDETSVSKMRQKAYDRWESQLSAEKNAKEFANILMQEV